MCQLAGIVVQSTSVQKPKMFTVLSLRSLHTTQIAGVSRIGQFSARSPRTPDSVFPLGYPQPVTFIFRLFCFMIISHLDKRVCKGRKGVWLMYTFQLPSKKKKDLTFLSLLYTCPLSVLHPSRSQNSFDQRDVQCLRSKVYLDVIQTESEVILWFYILLLYNCVFSLELIITYYCLLFFNILTTDSTTKSLLII